MGETLYAVFGAAGYGREVMPLARSCLQREGVAVRQLVFIDDNPPASHLNYQRVSLYADFLAKPASQHYVAIAVANSQIRQKLADRIQNDGVQPWSIQADNVIVMDDVIIGEGALLSPFVTLTSNIRIGRYFHANIYSYVAHDCVIGDYVTFAPSVKCNGNVTIEDHAYIGTGAILRQGKPGQPLVIGKGAVVGMGAVVTKDVAAGVTVVGNPARPLIKS